VLIISVGKSIAVQGMNIEVATEPVVENISFRHYIRCLDGRRGFMKIENYTNVFKLWYL
jgi:hypothetical protein